MLTRKVVFVAAIGLAAFVASFAFHDHLMHISPTAPNPATHQVHELNQHGYLFYITSGQYFTFFTLLLGGWWLIFVAVVLSRLAKRRCKFSFHGDAKNI